MDAVTVVYIGYKIFKWLKGKPDSESDSSGCENSADDTLDDIADVLI